MAEIKKRGDGKYLVRLYTGRTEAGKVLTQSKVIAGYQAAKDYARDQEKARTDGTLVEPSKETVNRYLDRWLAAAAPQRSNTKQAYAALLTRYVRPALGDRRLGTLRPPDIQALYTDMGSRGLAPRTIRYTHAVLRRALEQAVDWGELARNPARKVKLPKPVAREMHALAPEQAGAFLAEAAKHRHRLVFELALATGMRPSEYLALRWKDVDRKAGTVTVQRVWTGSGFAEPKTKRSRRTIPLPAGLTTTLTEHYLKAALKEPDALVFPSETIKEGQAVPLNERELVKRFTAVLTAAKLPETVRLYDLRHTCATLLLGANVNPKVVSERLGHASITLTLDTYSHVLPTMQEKATAALDGLLYGATEA